MSAIYQSVRMTRITARTWLILVAVVVGSIIAALWLRSAPRDNPAQARTATSQPEKSSPVAANSEEPKVVALTPAPPAVPTRSARPAVKAKPSPFSSYGSAVNLTAIAGDLIAAADHGDGEAMYVLYMISQECASVPVQRPQNPNATLQIRQILQNAARSAQIERCRGLKETFPAIFEHGSAYRQEAAAAGNSAGLASNGFFQLTMGDSEAADEAARRALQDPDGYALKALYGFLSLRNGGMYLGGPIDVSNRPAYEAAWFLAECQFGLPCGSDSPLLRSMCINKGACGAESYYSYAQSTLPPEAFQMATAWSNQIARAINEQRPDFFGIGVVKPQSLGRPVK